jgi:hypothetical protein
MSTAYLAITLLAAAANFYAAARDFTRDEQVAITMARLRVPASWMTPLGILKAVGALGLLIGIVVPPIGLAAAIGLALFFVGAIITHLRGHFYAFGAPASFLLLAVAALVLRLAASGVSIAA